MGTSVECSCCNLEEKRNEMKYGINNDGKNYEFKIRASFNLNNLFD